MVSVMERRKHARSKHPAGSVSRHAQRRVDERVIGIMARSDAAAGAQRDGQECRRRADQDRDPGRDAKTRMPLETDQTAADLDQTQADFDQAESDADQLASDADQKLADGDQNASDRDQVLADWEHDHAPVAALTDQAYQTSRAERRAASRQRGSTAAVRSSTSGERLATAARRDDAARARDITAAARDRTAESRDAAADLRDAAAEARDAAADIRDSAREESQGRAAAGEPSVPEAVRGGD